uniref:Uncharacterized protein n=1 Tax=uncultured Thiotrichaceae bacterium TaxID=298394 RepID=A0A6S6UGZ8_9GAMM|nr:MAG: Unknown protein [uncultured Thiotrichaceae bacterium]
MECLNKTVNRLNATPLMISGLLLLSGCEEPPAPQADIRITDRPVATVYKIKSAGNENVQCYRIQNSDMTQVTTLKSEQLVDIVAVEEGLVSLNDKLWLQVYPRLTHRPSCYVNVDNLIPYG